MAVHLTKGERVRLRHRPHFTGTVVARREGNVDVRWDADGCTATTRQWRLQRILENPGKVDHHGIERDLDGKPVCRKCRLALADENGLCPQCNADVAERQTVDGAKPERGG